MKMKRLAKVMRSGQEGMTLLEMMIVIAIIALVMGFLLGPRLMEALSGSKENVAKMLVDKYAGAYAGWAADAQNSGKQCPNDLSELLKYANQKDTKDQWGNELVMLCGDQAPEGAPYHFGVVSKGPDGKLNTDDDIKSWGEKEKK